MTLIFDVVFALSQSIPEFDSLVARTRDDLPVISTEADGQDIGGVADEATGRGAGVQIPKTESVVPG